MKISITFPFMLVLLIITGCNGSNPASEPSQTTATIAVSMASPAPEGLTSNSTPISASQVTPLATLTPSLQPDATPSIPKNVESMKGDTLKDQSFQVDFEYMGKSEFITTIEKAKNFKDQPHFYIKNGDKVSELKYELNSSSFFFSVSAVSFRDVSGDGRKDIIIIMDYITGVGYMSAIPFSQLLIFKQGESGFFEDQSIEENAIAGVPYRILSVQDVMIGLKTNPKDSAANAWERLHPGTYQLDSSGELAGATLTIKKATGDSLMFSIDAYYAPNKEAAEKGGVNTGIIGSGIANPSYSEMIFKDGIYELSFEMISNSAIYLHDNGKPYFGLNVSANGTYTLK